MKRLIILKAAALAAAVGASAQVNNPALQGRLERGQLMLTEGNYRGCLDQLGDLPSSLSPAEAETVAWLRASALYHGALPGARKAIEEFIEAFPASQRRYQATLYLANTILADNPEEALSVYATLRPSAGGTALRPDLLYHQGYAYLLTDDYDKAAACFKSVETDSDFGSDARFYLGYIAYERKRYDEALAYMGRTDRRRLPGASADYYEAQIYYIKGEYPRAVRAARSLIGSSAVADNPTFAAEARRILGESLYHEGDVSKAISELEKYAAMTSTPEPSAMYILGTTLYTRGDYAKAVKYLKSAVGTDSAMGQSAYLYIGEAFMKLGDTDAALLAFDGAVRSDFDPDVREAAYYNYAVAKLGGGTVPFGSSTTTFEDFLQRYPSGRYTPAVQEYLVAGYLTDHNYDAALQSINRMAKPTDKVLAAKQRILYTLGTRALATDPSAARTYLSQATALADRDPAVAAQVNLSLGEALYRLGDYDEAAAATERYLAAAPDNDPNRAVGYYDLGYARFALKDYAGAESAFKKLLAAPTPLAHDAMADACNRLGDAAMQSNRLADAAAYYDRAFKLAPAAGDYPLFRKAVINGYRRDYSGKLADIDRLLQSFPTSALIPDALLEKAEAYIQMQRPDDAVATYRTLIKAHPSTSQGRSGYVQMAMVMLGQGKRAEAAEAYRTVIKNHPTSDEAAVAVEELQRMAAQDGTLADFGRFLASVSNAPQLDVAKSDRLTFEAAENAYIADGNVTRLQEYLQQYPDGASRSTALAYLMEDARDGGRVRDALTYATSIVEAFPDSRIAEDALAVKAESLHSLGQGEESLETWQILGRRASTPEMQCRARLGTMRLAADLGNHALVIEQADALLASSAAGGDARHEATFARGLALQGQGNTAEARKAWKSIASLTDDLSGVKSAVYLGQSYFDGGDFKSARKAADDVIASGTPHTYWLARAFVLLSDVLASTDKTFEAREYLRSLRENYPGTESDIFQMIDTRLTNLK